MSVAVSRLASALFAGIVAAATCRADSFASSSASSAGSASVGSLSDSITSASGSLTNALSEGDYRIVEVARAARPDTVRLKMVPLAREGEESAAIHLDVPRPALGDREAAPGVVVGVRQRPYGYEFAWADTRTAFFLALTPQWQRELEPRAL